MASDAFFPFDDCVCGKRQKAGITAVIQPGGSLEKTKTVFEAQDELVSCYGGVTGSHYILMMKYEREEEMKIPGGGFCQKENMLKLKINSRRR